MTRNRLVLLCGVFCLALMLVAGCGSGRPHAAKDPYRFIRDHNLKQLPRFDIPIEINDRVIAWMEYFQGPGRNHFRRYMERSGRYVPLMQEILRKNGMPADLVYIAMIESGFNTQARSWASAVGPWQFISATGKRYGMRVDSFVDERRDPYLATQAAVEYFKDLYNEFGDWYLAMAGYNAGEGTVRRAIASTGSRNFWEIASGSNAFRPETRDYVPKFIAAAIMAKMPERFGFEKIDYREPFDYDSGSVETQTDLGIVAKCAGVSEDAIVDLNPHLVRGTTPPGARNYQIRLPRGTSKMFKEKYAAIPPDERIQVVRYEVRKGDTLARVARRYGVSAGALASANGLSAKQKRLTVGSTLTIPTGSGARYAVADDDGASRSDRADKASRGGKKSAVHTVRKGETLAAIARRYGVTTNQVMAWNNIRSAKKVHAGMRLTIKGQAAPAEETTVAAKADRAGGADVGPVVPGKVHRVAKGETLSTIASRYGVTTKQLVALNDLAGGKHLQAGQKLVIRRPKTAPAEEAVPAGAVASAAEAPAASAEGEPVDVREAAPAAETAVQVAPTKKAARVDEPAAPAKQHKVGKGDTIGAIAAKYGIPTKELMAMNNITNPKAIRPGQQLVVQKGKAKAAKSPARGADATQKVAAIPSPQAVPAPKPPAPQVQVASAEPVVAGETAPMPVTASPSESLSDQLVPLSPQTTAIDLRERDVQGAKAAAQQVASVKAPAVPKPAPATAVPPKPAAEKASSTSYKVKNGDTLWDIARRHKVSIAQIQKWNNLADPSAVKPGTTLTIHKE